MLITESQIKTKIPKTLKEKKNQSNKNKKMEPTTLYPKGNGILFPTKLLIKCEGILKIFLDIQYLNELLELLQNSKSI